MRGASYTGPGSDAIYVARELEVEKKADDTLRITLKKTAKGVEIVACPGVGLMQ